MPVEPAVGEFGALHDIGDADPAEPLGTEQCARYLNNTVARLGGLFATDPHDAPALCVSKKND